MTALATAYWIAVRTIQFCGDFFTQGDLAELEKRLTGARYDRAGLTEALQGVEVGTFFEGMTNEGLVEFLY